MIGGYHVFVDLSNLFCFVGRIQNDISRRRPPRSPSYPYV